MKRTVSKGPLDYYYLKISLEFDDDRPDPDICLSELRQLITVSLRSLFGEVGAAICVDVLKYIPSSRQAILRVPHRGYIKLRNALSLCGKFSDRCCAFQVHQVSAHLMALAVNSRCS